MRRWLIVNEEWFVFSQVLKESYAHLFKCITVSATYYIQ